MLFSLFVVLVFFVLSAHRAKIHVLKPRTNRSREPFAWPGFHTALLLKSRSVSCTCTLAISAMPKFGKTQPNALWLR